uniref:3'-5' exonuclease n=1 Tax=Roseihalotalea indica TaxID=2867963 RepID=A0AA49GN15_9BACT|nr:3'-5' exonuclease [Tunicatimonas sp. TK19036]
MATDLLSSNILFVDIETVTAEASYDELSPIVQKAWDRKAEFFRDADTKSSAELFQERAALYAEFGKIISITVGYFHTLEDEKTELRIKCIAHKDEAEVLKEFKETVKRFDQNRLRLCAHNGRDFDYPYLCRRMLIHGIELPASLHLMNKKAWEVPHLDTMEMWKFGEYKKFVPLDLLASLFNVDVDPDTLLDARQIQQIYYQEEDLKKMTPSCYQNIRVLAQVYLSMMSQPQVPEELITTV